MKQTPLMFLFVLVFLAVGYTGIKSFAYPAFIERQLSFQNTTAVGGQQVTTNILVDAIGDESTYNFVLNYDTTALNSPVVFTPTISGTRICNTTSVPGQITCSIGNFADNNPASSTDQIGEIPAGSNQNLVRIRFNVASSASGLTSLGFSTVETTNDANQSLPIKSQGGTITISPGPTPTPSPSPTPNSCSYGIAPSSQNFSALGGNGTIAVATTNGCSYSAFTTDSFITINSSGIDGGAIEYTVSQNPGAARTGKIFIGNLIFTVNQDATMVTPTPTPTPIPNVCSYSTAVSSQPFSAAGGNGSIDVTASSGCPVRAFTNDVFIVVNSDGSNGGAITFTVGRNFGDVRHGSIYIGNLIIRIDQFAGMPKSRTRVKFF